MSDWLERTKMIFGDDAIKRLASCHVAVFGLGGVGGCAVEGLVRGGVGELTLVDDDVISETNLNRQILATAKTLGRSKTKVAKERCLDINPDVIVHTHEMFFMPKTKNRIDFSEFDYIIDAIDTVTGKIALIEKAKISGVPIISSMGTGNKLDNTAFKVSDIFSTSGCPLAKVMRKELKARGLDHVKVVYSPEVPINHSLYDRADQKVFPDIDESEDKKMTDENPSVIEQNGRHAPGSTSFVPPVAGFILAGEVLKDLVK